MPTPVRPLAAALLLVAGLAAPALAATAPARTAAPKPALATGDVTRAQMQIQIKAAFDRADTNHDGFMSRTEFGKRMGVVLNRIPQGTPGAPDKAQAQKILDAANAAFQSVDTNHDGKLSLAEASRRPLAAFDKEDANHDGILTVAEKIDAHREPTVVSVPAN